MSPHPKRAWTSTGRRGLSALGIVFLLVLIGVFAMAYHFTNQNERDAKRQFGAEQEDPESMLGRLFIELSKKHEFKEATWEKLLQLMSADDQQWLAQNLRLLASQNARTEGMVALAATPRELQFSALEYLLRLDQPHERPVIIRIATDSGNKYAVAYVHPPNRVQLMSEIFLVREGLQWKARRFLGARDQPPLLGRLIEAKTFSDVPLSDDESDYKRDSAGYPDRKRAQLLADVGLSPTQSPDQAAAPAAGQTPGTTPAVAP